MTGFASGLNFNKPARKLSLNLDLGDSHMFNDMTLISQPSLSVCLSSCLYISPSLCILD